MVNCELLAIIANISSTYNSTFRKTIFLKEYWYGVDLKH